MSESRSDKWRSAVAFYLNDSETIAGKIIDLLLLVVNITACAVYVLKTYFRDSHAVLFMVAELVIVSIFSVEYILRIFCAERKMGYIFSFYGIIDFVSIVPSFIPGDEFKFLRVLKVLRILRFIRFLETQTFFFGKVSRFRLQVLRTVFTVFTILFVSAGFIYSAEYASGNASVSINTFGEAFYFTVTTLSTVGFGDYVPVTAPGMAFTVIMIMGGAFLIPWQVGKLIRILAVEETGKRKVTCPQCGLIGHDYDASHCKACGHIIYQEYSGDLH